MANQVTVSNDHSINVTIEPPANVQVEISRAVIGTVANVASANFANFAGTAFNVSASNITGVVNLANFATTANSVAGANVSGAVANATYANTSGSANTAGTVITNAQPNITSVGTLTGLTSNGNIIAPFFIGNVVGNISGNFTVPGNNTAVLFNQTGNAGASDALTFNYVSNVLTANGNIVANYFIGNGSQLTDVNAVTSNIANTANSVAVANVVGIGNIAVLNIDGNLSNILYGNGIFAAVPNVSNVANANYANFAGTVITNAQPNITSVGTLTGLSIAGNIIPTSNITYDLGNNTNRFNDLYLAGNTIYIGAQEISANASGITVSGNLSGDASGLSNIAGANVTGQVGNALIAGTVYTNAQPNITSVGNLTSVTVSGDALVAGNLTVGGNISYVNVNNLVVQDPVIELGGGPNGAPLTTNDGKDRGTLLHYYTTAPIDAFMGWDNGNSEFAFGSNVTNNLDVMTFNTLGNVRAQTFIGNLTGLASSATVANSANAVAGANVSGQVNYAAVANSVAVANVSGIGNIATVNLDGNASNILFGNGVFSTVPNVSNVANANFANFAGNAFSVSGSNVSGAVGLATFATTANAVAGANVSGAVSFATTANSVALANVSGAGNIASINLDGNVSNVLSGNGSFVALPTVSANANYANFAGQVVDATQSNITTVGTLTSLDVTGNATFANSIILSSNIGIAKISGLDNGAGLTQRSIIVQGGNVSSNILANGNSAGSMQIIGGDARATTDPGSRWNANGGFFTMIGGTGSTANGSALGGAFSVIGGPGFSNLYSATGGNTSFSGGRAAAANGDATGGTIILTSGRANATTTGTATSGNINLNIGNANGVSGNTIGNINIGSLAANANVASPTSINIGQANTPTVIGGNINVTGVTNLGNVGNVIITGGTANYVLSTNGSGNLNWVAQSGGGGTPGGSNTQLQFNDNGTFGGISTVTWNGSNISLGAVGNVKVTGGVNNEVIRTDGTGNLSFSSIAQTLLVGTRAGPYTVPITNYTFQVTTRSSGNVTVYVN